MELVLLPIDAGELIEELTDDDETDRLELELIWEDVVDELSMIEELEKPADEDEIAWDVALEIVLLPIDAVELVKELDGVALVA